MAAEQRPPQPRSKGKEKKIGSVKYGSLLGHEFESLKYKDKKGARKIA